MDETQAFLDEVLPRQLKAERAIHDGDAALRHEMWSRREPVTLLGAAMACVQGVEEVHAAFDDVASWFSDCTSYDIEVVAAGASGDVAYTVVFERTSCTTPAGRPATGCG